MEKFQTKQNTVDKLVSNGKGILAADESINTMGKRLKSIELENTYENRTKWRKLLSETDNLEDYISGIILCDETLRTVINGVPLINKFIEKNILVGIKVDSGLDQLSGTINEQITKGLDNLRERCEEYYKLGARFTKWRVVFDISESTPSEVCIEHNLNSLARYAAISQDCGLVPIVEPEILMDGTHDINKSNEVTREILTRTYSKLSKHKVKLEHSLLKPNMIRPGSRNTDFSEIPIEIIARDTIYSLQNTVPFLVPGIMFLSGGMSERFATMVLNEIGKSKSKKPWYISFSFGRALQQSALLEWKGVNDDSAKKKLIEMCKNNCMAIKGKFNC